MADQDQDQDQVPISKRRESLRDLKIVTAKMVEQNARQERANQRLEAVITERRSTRVRHS